jgi:XisH protein
MARDAFHDAVRHALEKEGWRITDDPYRLPFGRDVVLIDLAASRMIAAERDEEQIAVEIKSFINPSLIHDFHSALGQYLNYRIVVQHNDPNRKLYLAIPIEAHAQFLERDLAQQAIHTYNVALLVYNASNEVIVQWI